MEEIYLILVLHRKYTKCALVMYLVKGKNIFDAEIKICVTKNTILEGKLTDFSIAKK